MHLALPLQVTLAIVLLGAFGGTFGTSTAHAASDCAVPPNNLAAALNADGSAIVLSWEASGECTPDTYAVYRRVMEDESQVTKYADVDGETLTYTDTAIEAGKTYRYRIRSNDRGSRTAVADVRVPEAEREPQRDSQSDPNSAAVKTSQSGNPVTRTGLPRAILPEYVVTFVSNLGARPSGSRSVDEYMYAQAFSTGSESTGYNLASVVVVLQDTFGMLSPGTTTVTVREDASGVPSDTVLYTLDHPALLQIGGERVRCAQGRNAQCRYDVPRRHALQQYEWTELGPGALHRGI